MQPFRTILFPTDFSQAALEMVPYVKETAQRFNGHVTVLNAFDLVRDYILAPPLEGSCESERAAAIPYVPALRELREQREQQLEEFTRAHFAGTHHSTTIEDGDPATIIEWVAHRESTDLIMMPTKGLGKFRRLLVGSVTAKVLHDVKCPVFTSAHEPGLFLAPPNGYHSILCAVGFNEETDVILEAASFFARVYAARLCLMHIEALSPRQQGRQEAVHLIRQALDRASNAEAGERQLEAKVRVLDAELPEGIRRVAMEEKADLVVVGRGHQKGNFSRMWSHLYTIIRESLCPVLSV
jgi:nucleotide-binding universal stress UspA family protein